MHSRETSSDPDAGRRGREPAVVTASPAADEAEPLVGRSLEGGWRLVAPIARGGVSTVYRAERGGAPPAAVKVLDRFFCDTPPLRERLAWEAALVGRLGGVAAARPFSTGVVDGRPYLVMELLDGTPLSARLAAGPLAPRVACRITVALLEALARVHALGVVHRDVKPSNVMLLDDAEGGPPRVRLLDFGMATLAGGAGSAPIVTGESVGTPAYAAPERLEPSPDRPVDGRADLYATGVVLFELLAGRRPFVGDPVEVLRARLERPAPPIARFVPSLSPSLAAILAQALERDPARRPPDAAAMARAIASTPEGAAA